MTDRENALNQLDQLVAMARRAGADEADAILADSASLSVGWRGGALEELERSESGDLGLRVIIGKRQAMVSGTDRRPDALREMVARAVAMAKAAPDDPYCGLAAPDAIASSWPVLESADDQDPDAATLIAAARAAEEAALSVKNVTMVESSGAGASRATLALVASNGFAGTSSRTNYSISVSALAGTGTAMEQDYDYASTVFWNDLPDAAAIGRRAGERAAALLGARQVPSGAMPVILDPREASGLLGIFAGAISGASVARGTSFLKDKRGKAVFPSAITITDDPFRPRGLRSSPFDAEGLGPTKRAFVQDGVLTEWLLDLRSARQLGLASTGHARRGTSGPPSPGPSNLYIHPGADTPEALIRSVTQGLYVTDLMGSGVNGVTGDYSLAARGFRIENGALSHPVNEITIASNLKDMFAHTHAANDLEFRHGLDSPTLLIESMTVAGL